MSRAFGHRCPHCEHPLRIRDSEATHPLMRMTYMQCTNDVSCGATFGGFHEIRYQFVPSANPRPGVNLETPPHAVIRQARRSLQEQQQKNQIDFIEEAASDSDSSEG